MQGLLTHQFFKTITEDINIIPVLHTPPNKTNAQTS
jgi:hypothetical protein